MPRLASRLPTASLPPSERALTNALGPTRPAWDALIEAMQTAHPPITLAWKPVKREFGCCCRLVHKKRTLLYLIPEFGQFEVNLVLGARATHLALRCDLPAAIRQAVLDAPSYIEGRLIRFPVSSARTVPVILRLVAAKLTPP